MKKEIRYPIISALLLIFFLQVGCSKSDPAKLVLGQYRQWKGLGITHYSYTLKVICFCSRETVGPHQVVISNNQIQTVNGQPYDPTLHGMIKTIDQLFEFMQATLSQNPYKRTIVYDPHYFFPTDIYFDFSAATADEEIGYQLTDFKRQ